MCAQEDLSSQMAGVNIQGSSSAADGSAGTSPIVVNRAIILLVMSLCSTR